MLESLKNTLIGKLHHPHTKFIDYGAHAITIEGVRSVKKGGKGAQNAEKVNNMIQMMESLVRAFDHIDEQLHAGYFFYILIGPKHFVSNTEFVYPVVFLLAWYLAPALMDFFDNAKNAKGNEL